MVRAPPPERPPRWRGLLGGPDAWRRVVLAGIVAGVVIAFAAALIAALINGSESGSLDEGTPTPTVPAAMRMDDEGYSNTMSPLLPPRLRASLTPSIRMPRSTALHMS